MAARAGGDAFKIVIAIDAVIILCATVLTSFIGVLGLLHNMARDGLLPVMFVRRNTMFDTVRAL